MAAARKTAKKKPATAKKKPAAGKKMDQLYVMLTAAELTHLRDLMSVLIPVTTDGQFATVSQVLAAPVDAKADRSERERAEDSLWMKVSDACERTGVDLGDSAPDYVVSVAGLPVLGVFPVDKSMDPEGAEDDDSP